MGKATPNPAEPRGGGATNPDLDGSVGEPRAIRNDWELRVEVEVLGNPAHHDQDAFLTGEGTAWNHLLRRVAMTKVRCIRPCDSCAAMTKDGGPTVPKGEFLSGFHC
jgi:hypothetical protein